MRPITALKTYGAVIADNGLAFYLSGVPGERWENDKLRARWWHQGQRFRARRDVVASGAARVLCRAGCGVM
ncbi:MAG: hypothetical protein N2037_01755 [Acidimicrobiales bacterium]|nr:hypothetical protein [Acidimicrobiales bacterium]